MQKNFKFFVIRKLHTSITLKQFDRNDLQGRKDSLQRDFAKTR